VSIDLDTLELGSEEMGGCALFRPITKLSDCERLHGYASWVDRFSFGLVLKPMKVVPGVQFSVPICTRRNLSSLLPQIARYSEDQKSRRLLQSLEPCGYIIETVRPVLSSLLPLARYLHFVLD
jgi:hypothetical protein